MVINSIHGWTDLHGTQSSWRTFEEMLHSSWVSNSIPGAGTPQTASGPLSPSSTPITISGGSGNAWAASSTLAISISTRSMLATRTQLRNAQRWSWTAKARPAVPQGDAEIPRDQSGLSSRGKISHFPLVPTGLAHCDRLSARIRSTGDPAESIKQQHYWRVRFQKCSQTTATDTLAVCPWFYSPGRSCEPCGCRRRWAPRERIRVRCSRRRQRCQFCRRRRDSADRPSRARADRQVHQEVPDDDRSVLQVGLAAEWLGERLSMAGSNLRASTAKRVEAICKLLDAAEQMDLRSLTFAIGWMLAADSNGSPYLHAVILNIDKGGQRRPIDPLFVGVVQIIQKGVAGEQRHIVEQARHVCVNLRGAPDDQRTALHLTAIRATLTSSKSFSVLASGSMSGPGMAGVRRRVLPLWPRATNGW